MKTVRKAEFDLDDGHVIVWIRNHIGSTNAWTVVYYCHGQDSKQWQTNSHLPSVDNAIWYLNKVL